MKTSIDLLTAFVDFQVLLDTESIVEALAAQLHALYQREARRQGDVRHADDYAALPEHTKDFDRVLARFILKHAYDKSIVFTMLHDPLVEGSC